MSYSKFTLALKSTLDYHAKILADSKNLPFVDMGAENFETQVLESDQPGVVWEFASLLEDPMPPMYTVMFDIGVMTFLDPSQYLSLDLVSMFLDAFKSGTTFHIKDYSGDTVPTETIGTMRVISSAVTPQQADRATGLRFVTVTARAVSYV